MTLYKQATSIKAYLQRIGSTYLHLTCLYRKWVSTCCCIQVRLCPASCVKIITWDTIGSIGQHIILSVTACRGGTSSVDCWCHMCARNYLCWVYVCHRSVRQVHICRYKCCVCHNSALWSCRQAGRQAGRVYTWSERCDSVSRAAFGPGPKPGRGAWDRYG